MTIRKPTHDGQSARGLPYPSSPSSPSQQNPSIDRASSHGLSVTPLQSEDKIEYQGMKSEGAIEQHEHRLPTSLRIGNDDSSKPDENERNVLPSSLQICPADITPRSSFDSQQSKRTTSPSPALVPAQDDRLPGSRLASNNPFLQHVDNTGSVPMNSSEEESSADIWADTPEPGQWHSQSGEKLVPAAVNQAQTLSSDSSYAPPTGASLHAAFPEPISSTKASRDEPFDDPWNDLSTLGTPEPRLRVSSDTSVFGTPEINGLSQNQQRTGEQYPQTIHAPENDKGLPPLPPRDQGEIAPALPPRHPDRAEEQPPAKPPRPQLNTSIAASEERSAPSQAELDRRKRQRSETYQIRLVNWFDASSQTNPRRSPIMVQNANGPCPLLALVNALVLSTPSGIDTALLDTLERREQVSLGLLLDAVIDELMSGRRGDAAQNLPDVSELYGFLVNLHTGMNVNPNFLPKDQGAVHWLDAPISGESASLSNFGNAGGFEDTREMKLYSTFAVPLIHGWLPSTTHPACAALQHSAKTYEDAQNLMFAEEGLEEKLSRQGLNQDEQRLLQDIASVKYFLSSSATQLTEYGLSQITDSLRPGSIAILFRNDHFSTLYRHPRLGQLFTLVTDMGYAGHDEVVWESLVDISGEGCEFFAGDFRPVGNNNTHPQMGNREDGDGDGWTTVRRSDHAGRGNGTNEWNSANPRDITPDISSLQLGDSIHNPTSPKAEQEDHDLALALQLQEEEEERERQENAARRRQDELSHAFLSSQPGSRGQGAKRGPEIRPSIPPRGSTSGRAGNGVARGGLRSERRGVASPAVSRPSVQPEDGEDAPPPTYEQAASGPAYHPPPNHPAHPNASPTGAGTAARPQAGLHRQSSAYAQNFTRLADSPVGSSSATSPLGSSPSMGGSRFRNGSGRAFSSGRGGPSGVEGAPGVIRRNGGRATEEAERDRDCMIM